jgi:predicted nucleic acid-binding protein
VNVVYDAGMLVAADRNDRRAWADHRARLDLGLTPIVPAPVVAQTSRSGQQAQLRRLLRGCEVVAFAPDEAHRVGSLLGAARATDVIDAHVAILASDHDAIVITSDDADLERLSACLPAPIRVSKV